MGGFLKFLAKEFREILRTWRLPVVAGVVLLFALTGPPLAMLTPQLLKSLQASQPGVIIQLPEPSWRDAYAQWIKNLTQIVSFVTVIAAAGSVAGEVASGTAVLVLTKPVSRAGFVVAKAISLFALIATCTVVGAALTQALTAAMFPEAPSAELWVPTLAWLAFAGLLIAVTLAFSTWMATLASAGMGVAVFFVLSMVSLWGPARRFSPAGVMPALGDILAGKHPALAWPIATTLAASVALVAIAAWIFTRREI